MDCFEIQGGSRLSGDVAISGAKNAALPILAATILASEDVVLSSVPRVTDVDTLSLVLGHLGVAVKRDAKGDVHAVTMDATQVRADYDLVRRMRASFCVLGPLLARRGKAIVSLPGGCNIGVRPVDVHLAGLTALGAEISLQHGYVVARAAKLRGANVTLTGPCGPSVTGTANVLMAAVLAEGESTLCGAAQEPEIVDLANFLNTLGAKISRQGTDTIHVQGVAQLGGGHYRIVPDRIEAATLLIAIAATQSRASISACQPEHLTSVLRILERIGCEMNVCADRIELTAPDRMRPVEVIVGPYPAIPSDVQAQLTALLALADGRSIVRDEVFPDRFMHVAELLRLGAKMIRAGNRVDIHGVRRLNGASVTASDLRASAALVIAGLAAQGTTLVRKIEHLDRGYEALETKLASLGANITRATSSTAAPTSRAISSRVA
jgi:UDP-N-acetylglucosamine 1-carboxyvinyltransferase